jgi:molybdenum cofactor synthesis domain-containing protein
MHRAIILAIGNELLIGETLDTNTNWLCRHLTALGLQVEHSLTLPDRLEIISNTINWIVNDKWLFPAPDLLITTGGLGPTDDDLTLASVAKALDLPLEIDQVSYLWIKEKYQELAKKSFVSLPDMNPAREKMAMLPKGSSSIENPVGVAPAMRITYKKTTIISLPGVPKEMKAFMLNPLQEFLSSLFGVGLHLEAELWALCGDESILAPILRQVSLTHPTVYIKSKAKGFGSNLRFQIKLHCSGKSGESEETKKEIKLAVDDLVNALKLKQIGIDKQN